MTWGELLFWISPLDPFLWLPYFCLLAAIMNLYFHGDISGGCYYSDPEG